MPCLSLLFAGKMYLLYFNAEHKNAYGIIDLEN